MTRQQQKEKRLQEEKKFIEKKDSYIKECFDVNSPYFLSMQKILENAKTRGLEKEIGYELHHAIPRSFFKKKGIKVIDKNNLYKLTYQEHFLVHFYAYKCATKFLKSSMSLALLQMKRVCTMNTNDVDTIKLSYIFNSIKTELYKVKKEDSYTKYFKQSFEKIDKIYNGKFELLKFNHIENPKNVHTELDIRCRFCGKTYHIHSGSYFYKGKFQCDCQQIGYKESVDTLWFAIDYRYNKAVWIIKTISYTPSMKKYGTVLKSSSKEILRESPSGPFEKISLIDIKPKGYNWNLKENKKFDKADAKTYILDSGEIKTFFKEWNSPECQKYKRIVRLGKGLVIPTWQLEFLLREYKKDPDILNRFKKILDKMCELNNHLDVRD